MSVYRTQAEAEHDWVEKPAAKLVRANGAVCTCSPPGWLYRWWHHVVVGDTWVCAHNGGWTWTRYDGWAPAYCGKS